MVFWGGALEGLDMLDSISLFEMPLSMDPALHNPPLTIIPVVLVDGARIPIVLAKRARNPIVM